MRQAAAHEAYQAKLPGAGARKMAAKAQAAGRRLKDRRAGGAEPPVRTPAPRTAEQVAAAERHQRLSKRQPLRTGTQPQPAEVARPSEAPGSKSTAAIGMPSMKKTAGGASTRDLGLSPNAVKNLGKLENIKKDPLGEINSKAKHNHYSAARLEAKGIHVAVDNETGKVLSHIGDLQRASDGLKNVIKALEHELEHPPSTITDRGREVLKARYFEAKSLQDRVKGFLNSIGHGKFKTYHTF